MTDHKNNRAINQSWKRYQWLHKNLLPLVLFTHSMRKITYKHVCFCIFFYQTKCSLGLDFALYLLCLVGSVCSCKILSSHFAPFLTNWAEVYPVTWDVVSSNFPATIKSRPSSVKAAKLLADAIVRLAPLFALRPTGAGCLWMSSALQE